ncbi:MAG: zinc ribbon domain-containing protein [Streptosporangiales bacterium]|nr:zinc ribbon domain-containing protein [Streptosporangiales bacterium]MBO0890422.1 zinc ribbon domain-containing protein [Acidothermales bacterium]
MATCPRCGAPAPDEGRFCRSCGGYLTAAASGPHDGDTQRLPAQDPGEARPRAIPAIDDEDVPPTTEAARLSMQAYPVEAPTPDQWEDPPDQGWYQNPNGQQPPPPGLGLGPPPPYPRQPPYGQPPPFGGQGGGGYEGADYYPFDDSPQRRGKSGRALILAIVGAVAAVALVFGGVLYIGSRHHGTVDTGSTTPASGGGRSSPASSPPASRANTPQQQATAVNQLLNRAVSGKSMLTTAYGQALSCKISPADAATQFEQAAKNRRAIVASARNLDTSKLPNGARIRQLLITMYGTSAKADDAFADWARAGDTAGDDCLTGNAKRSKGNSLSIRAGKQKRTFTKVWNPVAGTYHQPRRTEKSL